MPNTCPVSTCLAIAAITNDAIFTESNVQLIGLQDNFLSSAKLGVNKYAETDVIPADAELDVN